MTDRKKTRWLWFIAPLAICLPCIFPAVIAAFLAVGGAGAVGSFVSGTGGVLALSVGAVLLVSAAAIYGRWRWKRRITSA